MSLLFGNGAEEGNGSQWFGRGSAGRLPELTVKNHS